MKTWILPVDGEMCRVVLEKDTLDIWVNGKKVEVAAEFTDDGTVNSVSSVVELKMVRPKMQDFCPRNNMLKGILFKKILRLMPVCQKLGMVLENKVVQKLKLEKSVVFTKNGLLIQYS